VRANLFLDGPFLGTATIDVDARDIGRCELGGIGEVDAVGGRKLDDDGIVKVVGAELALARILAGGENVGEDHGGIDDVAVISTKKELNGSVDF